MSEREFAFLDDARGLTVNFPDGISEHGQRLMDSLGVQVTTDPFATSTGSDDA